jgi:hypothetical protein
MNPGEFRPNERQKCARPKWTTCIVVRTPVQVIATQEQGGPKGSAAQDSPEVAGGQDQPGSWNGLFSETLNSSHD